MRSGLLHFHFARVDDWNVEQKAGYKGLKGRKMNLRHFFGSACITCSIFSRDHFLSAMSLEKLDKNS